MSPWSWPVIAALVTAWPGADGFNIDGGTTTAPGNSYEQRHQSRVEGLENRMAAIELELQQNPNHPRRDELRTEQLTTKYELDTLLGRPFDDLESLIKKVRASQPGPELATACDYWELRAELTRLDRPTRGPGELAARVRRVDQFVQDHPKAQASVGLISETIEAAYADGDVVTVERWLRRLSTDFPDHPTTRALRGRDRLRRTTGEPWMPALVDVRGQTVDWTALRGRPVLVLFVASWDRASRRLVEQVSRWRDPRVVVIGLDRKKEDTISLARRLGPSTISCCDERGWATPLADEWGVRSLPFALVLDAQLKLRQIVTGTADDPTPQLETAWRDAGGLLE